MPETMAYILLAISGAIWGLREKTHQRPNFFELAFGVSPTSFFGSQQWKRKYIDHDGGERMPKTKLLSVFPYNDFWHSSWYVVKAAMIGCCIWIGNNTDGWKSLIIAFILSVAVTTIAAGISFRAASMMEKKQNL